MKHTFKHFNEFEQYCSEKHFFNLHYSGELDTDDVEEAIKDLCVRWKDFTATWKQNTASNKFLKQLWHDHYEELMELYECYTHSDKTEGEWEYEYITYVDQDEDLEHEITVPELEMLYLLSGREKDEVYLECFEVVGGGRDVRIVW